MNIWYFSAHDQPKGKSSRIYDYSLQLIELGHSVTIFTNSYCHWSHKEVTPIQGPYKIEYIDGIRVVWLKTFHYKGNGVKRGLNMIDNMRRAFQTSRAVGDRPDVIIGPSVPIGTGWAALKIARNFKCSFVYEVRDVWPIALVDDGGLKKTSLTYLVFRYMEKVLYRKSDKISTAIPFIHDHVRRSGANANKIEWMPNGIITSKFSSYNNYDGGEPNKIHVMYIGGFAQSHDVISIVRSAKILQDCDDDRFKFTIIGDGPKKPECVNFSKINSLNNIEFRSPISKSDIPKVQQDADIFVSTSVHSKRLEFGLNANKIYDYFASARPVIFAGMGSNNIVDLSGSGYTTPPHNPEKLVEALRQYVGLPPKDRVKMGRLGYKYVSDNFEMSLLGKKMELLLFRAIDSYRENSG